MTAKGRCTSASVAAEPRSARRTASLRRAPRSRRARAGAARAGISSPRRRARGAGTSCARDREGARALHRPSAAAGKRSYVLRNTGPARSGETPATDGRGDACGPRAPASRPPSARRAAAPQSAIIHLKRGGERPRQDADEGEERLRQDRVLVEEVAIRPEARTSSRARSGRSTRRRRTSPCRRARRGPTAALTRKRPAPKRDEPPHRRDQAAAPVPIAASENPRTRSAPMLRFGTIQAHVVFAMSFRGAPTTSRRTAHAHVIESTLVSAAEANASANVGRGKRASARAGRARGTAARVR